MRLSSRSRQRYVWFVAAILCAIVACEDQEAQNTELAQDPPEGLAGATTLAGAGGRADSDIGTTGGEYWGDSGGEYWGDSDGGEPPIVCDPSDVAVQPDWARALAGDAMVFPRHMVTEESGATYVVGSAYPDADFGGGPVAGDGEIFLLKLDASGAHVWSRRVGDGELDSAMSLVLASNGDVLISGYMAVPSTDETQNFIARFDPTGQSVADIEDFGNGLLTETASGKLRVWDEYAATGEEGELDIVVMTLGADGEIETRLYGGPGWDTIHAVAVDEASTAYVVGVSGGEVDFGAGPLAGAGEFSGAFLAALDDGLNPLWQRHLPELENHQLASGLWAGHVALHGSTVVVAGSQYRDNAEMFVDYFDVATGELIQSRVYPGRVNLYALAILPDGGVALGGAIDTGADLGGGPLLSKNDNGAFMARFAPNGDHVWSTLFCSSNTSAVRSLSLAEGKLHGLLSFYSNLELGSSKLTVSDYTDSAAIVAMPPDP